MATKIPLTFRIYRGDELLSEETLTQPVIKIGKLSSSHIRLADESVSRMHAVIEVTGPDDICVIDLSSSKGTIVNGQRVNKAKLQNGDEIVLGDIRIELSIGDAISEVTEIQASPPRANRISVPPSPPAIPGAPAVMSQPQRFSPPPSAPSMPAAPPAFGADANQDMGGARAIEVAAMLGDSVVAVRHVQNPRGGKVSATTWMLFLGGFALLAVSAFAFLVSVDNATANKLSFDAWAKAGARPIQDWRPERISLLYDWLAFGGLIGGLFCAISGLLRVRAERIAPFFRIGTAPEVEFPTDDAPAESFPLVAPSGDDFVLNFSQDMSGELMLDGQTVPLSQLAAGGRARPSSSAPGATEVPIPAKARFRVQSGIQTFMISSVPEPRKQAALPLLAIPTAVLMFVGISAAIHFGFLGLLFTIPPDAKALSLDSLNGQDRLSSVQAKAQEDPKLEEDKKSGKDDDSGGTGTKMALDEGKMGKKDSARATGQYAMKNNEADPQLAREQAMDNARRTGILGELMQKQGGAFASLTGTADFSSGIDDQDVYGGLLGNEVGEMNGGFGYGVSGTGPGGGGTGWGTIGTGRYGTIGHGSGTGDGFGSGSGSGGLRGRTSRAPVVNVGTVSSTGDLDKNIIRRYIRQKLPRIRNCYERELLANDGLAGTVMTQFQISPSGTVQGASASGMSNPKVEDCVREAIESIQFPKPKGGGRVNVRYPFEFRSSGS